MLQVCQGPQVPAAALVPSHVREDPRAAPGGLADPLLAAAGSQRGHGRAGPGRALREGPGARRRRGLVTVRDHRALALVGHRDGDGAVPAGDGVRHGQVDALALFEGVPAVLAVVVVPEGGGQRGAQTEPGQGGGHVGDAAGAGAHAARPGLRTAHRGGVEAGEDDVEEDGSGQEDVTAGFLGVTQRTERVHCCCADFVVPTGHGDLPVVSRRPVSA